LFLAGSPRRYLLTTATNLATLRHMPSVYDIKPAFQALLRPITRGLASAGVTANAVTVAAMILSLGLGGVIAVFPTQRWVLFVLPAALFVRMALNAIDGMLAREHNMKSRLGAILNEAGDVISDAALYLPLARVAGFDHYGPWALAVIVVLAGVSELTGVLGATIGGSRRYDGPMGKSDRALVFGAVTLLLGCGVPINAGAVSWVDGVLAGVLLLLVVTIFNRAAKALGEGKQ
jgi:CDP-diacylglycerol--glycerol-3-phosphate 3-phosphatidyltransferase